jgi:hypothetical protein
MPWVDLGNGVTDHICTRGPKPRRCGFCSTGYVEKLCDHPIGHGKRACDAGMCNKCATNVGPDTDYWPPHARHAQRQKGLFEGAK